MLNKVIDDSVLMFVLFMESRKVRVQKSLLDCEISGDAELLKQVFMNIIINAIQSMADGGDLDVIMRRNEKNVVVDLNDNGKGIKHECIEKIFDPFFSTKDTGSGLGLAIASMIMQAHGGYIKIRSKEGEGSTFSLYFPQKEDK
jgi:signal transduction histidine kinase